MLAQETYSTFQNISQIDDLNKFLWTKKSRSLVHREQKQVKRC